MIQWIFHKLARLSGCFHWDVLWRIIRRLNRSDRLFLLTRMLQNEVDYCTFRRHDSIWNVSGGDISMCWPLLVDGHFQGEQIDAVGRWLEAQGRLGRRDGHIVDVGANIGTTCIPLSRQTGCRVLAIEPFPENYLLLRKNVLQNGLAHRITCVQSAIHDQGETVEMFMPQWQCGGARIHESMKDHDGAGRIASVPASGLMAILKSSGIQPQEVALVWSDTEGAEIKVVETGEALWAAGVPLYMEVYPLALNRYQAGEALIRLLPRYFDRFISARQLMASGHKAETQSIAQFPQLLNTLSLQNSIMDILLLPTGFV